VLPFPARLSRELLLRQEEQPKPIPRDRLGRQSSDCAHAIASSHTAASLPMSSPLRSPASWQASSGPSPAACRQCQADKAKPVTAAKGGPSDATDTLPPGSAGCAVAVRRPCTTICRVADPTLVARPRQLRDASTVMRFQPAHQSMINRRHDDRASGSARHSPKQALEIKPRIHAPATCKGGHEIGLNLTYDTQA
jgi:hypothetical protein